MSKQLTLGAGFGKYAKTTRRARFLSEMERIVPWGELCELIAPVYPVAGKGRPPRELEMMLRIYFLQQWFNLCDPGAEDALYDSLSMRRFVGLDLGESGAPDETTICRFRHLLERNDLGKALFIRARAPRTPRHQGGQGHHRRCLHHQRAALDKEQGPGARPRDASDEEGQAVVLRDEGPHRGGQPHQGHPCGGGEHGQCA